MPAPGSGAAAPRFSLPDLSGAPRRLDDLLAPGPLWLLFVKSSCPTCRLVLPFAERIQQALEAAARSGGASNPAGALRAGALRAGAAVITEDTPADAAGMAAELGLKLPVLVEAAPWPVSRAYGLESVPTLFIVEPDGTLSASLTGFVKAEWAGQARAFVARIGRASFEIFTDADPVPEWKPG